MDRFSEEFEKKGAEVSKKLKYKTFRSLPFSLYGIITSGFFGNIYAATMNKRGPKKIKYILKDPENLNKLNKIQKKVLVVKIMYNDMYNRRDINRLRKIQSLIKGGICPHFPIIYGFFEIEKFDFLGPKGNGIGKNGNIELKTNQGPAVGYLMENLGDMNLSNYVFWKPEANELKQILFQCFIAIFVLVKYAKMNHGDLHFKNVMLYNLTKPQTFFYNIEGVTYKVFVKTYFPVLIDINGNLMNVNSREYIWELSQMRDVKLLSRQMAKLLPKIWNEMNININTSSLRKFFAMNFKEFQVENKNPKFRPQISNNLESFSSNTFFI